jgi:predicted O-methyltransferase YrrM
MSNHALPIAAQIEAAVSSIPGWSPIDQLLTLFTLGCASAAVPGDILEVGSWCGRSAVALGMAARLNEGTKVHCVDLFPARDDWYRNADGSYSFSVVIDDRKVNAYSEQTVWEEPFKRDIAPIYERYAGTLDAFSEAVRTHDLSDVVFPIKGDLESFALNAPSNLPIRMAFVDGDHSYAAVVNDIDVVERYLLPGGWLCLDDAFSSYAGVNEAIEERILASGKYDFCQQMTRKLFVARRRR